MQRDYAVDATHIFSVDVKAIVQPVVITNSSSKNNTFPKKMKKTKTHEIFNVILLCLWFNERANASTIAKQTKLDRAAVTRALNTMEDLCVVRFEEVGNRKYYEIEPAIEIILQRKGSLLVKRWLRKL